MKMLWPSARHAIKRGTLRGSTMSTRKIGGEYGEVRATIDLEKLNQYLSARVPVVSSPVTVKQFKVCS